MGKSNKKTNNSGKVAKTKKITLGALANSFYDAATGISFAKGEVKELTLRQYTSSKIKKALATGHLVIASNDNSSFEEDTIDDLKSKFDILVNQGMEVSKIAKAFNKKQAVLIAEAYDIEAEPSDTIESLFNAILEEIEGKKPEVKSDEEDKE